VDDPIHDARNYGAANRWIALLSVALATAVWYAIREAISFEQVVQDVPVRIEAGTGKTVLDQSAETVDVWFRGARSDLIQLDRDRLRIEVIHVPAAGRDSRQAVDLKPVHVRGWTGGARAVRFEPSRVEFGIDDEGERQVPVRAEFQDAPPEGYEISAVTCTPATVTLRGPLSRLEEIERVHTQPIDLQGRVQSFRVRAGLAPLLALPAARLDPDRVSVGVEIVEHAATREFAEVPVMVLVHPGRVCHVLVEPATVRVQLQGRAALLSGLVPESLTAFVDAAGVERDQTYELRVRVAPPSGARAVLVEPPSVRVRLAK